MKLSARATRLIEGFTTELPTVVGRYLCACSETDHEDYTVTLLDGPDGLMVNDPELGAVDLNRYDLTDLLWKRLDFRMNTGTQPYGDGMTKFEVVLYCGTRVITRGLDWRLNLPFGKSVRLWRVLG